MNELLKRHLTPDDDGRAFTEAVLLRASGALYRRRTAAVGADAPAWEWLQRWARPWVVAALIALAGAALVPALPRGGGSAPAETASASDALLTAPVPDLVLAVTYGN
jgi:hypothetical protein